MAGTSEEDKTRERSSESTIVAGGRNQERKTEEEKEEVIKKNIQICGLNNEDAQDWHKWRRRCRLADNCKQGKNGKFSCTNG